SHHDAAPRSTPTPPAPASPPPSGVSTLQNTVDASSGPAAAWCPLSRLWTLVLLDPPSPDHCANPRSAAGAPHRALTEERVCSPLLWIAYIRVDAPRTD